ncbi:MAG: 2-oxo acid dehydrogenase subunit E2 [Candidatus Eremiobacteraeota bacterium]|nr:2-oxo acid dehydrogenase subunit E2 [Candidatus Eremiobacteraeota bacterium]
MSSSDEFFDRSEFVQYFRDETEELLQSIDADLLRLEQFVDSGSIDAEIVASLFRALHTIKGSAGMLEFSAVQLIAHKLENVYDLLRKDRMPLTESGINLLFEGRDVLTALIREAIAGGETPSGVEEYVERLDAFAGIYDSTAQAIEGPRAEADGEEDLTPLDDAQVAAFQAEVERLLAASAAPAAAGAVAPALNARGATAPPKAMGTAKPSPGDLIPLTQARKIIAQRMVESKHTAPHAWTMTEVDVTNVWKWRVREKDAFEKAYGVKLTLLPFFVRAAVESLAAFPLMNASFTDEGIRVHGDVNVGLAIAAGGNLVVPVIRHADQLSIKGIALAAGELIDKARRNKLGADDLAGGTFTVNNTGANGSILSAPILVPGQTGIVTTEAVVKRPVVRDDDSIAIRSMMNVCMSLDHRVVDGAVASGFLSDLKKRLEAMGPTGDL